MSDEENIKDQKMGIFDHLGELRVRLTKAFIALAVTTIFSFWLTQNYLLSWLIKPIGGAGSVIAIEVTETIGVFMKISLLSGFILALPIILYQVVAFVSPGLTDQEVNWLKLFIPAASILFVIGVTFTYFVMLPAAIPFLVGFISEVKATPTLSKYIEFITSLMFWVGVAFETPLVMFILAKLKIVNARMLASQWRIAIVAIAVISAIITPTPDPVNMGLLMLPLMALYALSILMARIAAR